MSDLPFRLAPLSSESPLPLYHQLKEQLREAIRHHAFGPDQALPKELDLAEQLGVSRSVVRQAILQLVSEGFLRRVPGKGTFVASQSIEYDLLGFYNFKREVERQGQHLSIRLLAFEKLPMDPVNSSLFGVSMDTQLFGIWRTLLVAGAPVLLERTTLPASLAPNLRADDVRDGAFLHLLTGLGLEPSRAKKYVEPRLADPFESHELGLRPGMPVLVIDRYTYGPGDGPVIARCVWTVRGDRCRHFINLDRHSI